MEITKQMVPFSPPPPVSPLLRYQRLFGFCFCLSSVCSLASVSRLPNACVTLVRSVMCCVCSHIQCRKKEALFFLFPPYHLLFLAYRETKSACLSKFPNKIKDFRFSVYNIYQAQHDSKPLKPYLNVNHFSKSSKFAFLTFHVFLYRCLSTFAYHLNNPKPNLSRFSPTQTNVCDFVHACKCQRLTRNAVQDTMRTTLKEKKAWLARQPSSLGQ